MSRWISGFLASWLLVAGLAWSEEQAFVVPVAPNGVQRVEITGSDYFFKPAHIVVKVNRPVVLSVLKEGWLIPHDIVIDAPDAGIVVNESLGGDPKEITFTPTKTGVYSFYCSKKPPFMKSHREKGMEGKLEVVE